VSRRHAHGDTIDRLHLLNRDRRLGNCSSSSPCASTTACVLRCSRRLAMTSSRVSPPSARRLATSTNGVVAVGGLSVDQPQPRAVEQHVAGVGVVVARDVRRCIPGQTID
jgi:hypothetical protein